jgi:hypothetical protein
MNRYREFVQTLGKELPLWEAEGLVTPDVARAIAARYEAGADAAPARDRTGSMAVTAAIAVTLALAISLLASGISDGVLLPIAALAAAFAATPLAVRGDALAPAADAVRAFGRYLFYAAAYALTFVPVAEAARFRTGLASEGLLSALPPFLLGAAALLAGHRRAEVDAHTRGEAMLLVATVAAFAAGLSLDTGGGTALVATMALSFLAVGRIVRGLSSLSRPSFFEGVAVAALVVGSRGFDIFPSFWISVGVAAGVLCAAVAALVGFERRRAREPEDEEEEASARVV